MTLGQKIKAERIAAGLTQSELADKIGLDNYQAIGFIERKVEKTSITHKLCDFFNLSIDGEKRVQPKQDDCKDVLHSLVLKLISMNYFAQEFYTEKAYQVTQQNIQELLDWIKNKRKELEA